MPFPGAAGARRLLHHFGMVVTAGGAEQPLDGVDHAIAAGEAAEDVVARRVPERQPGLVPVRVEQLVGMPGDLGIGSRHLVQSVNFV